MARTVHLDIVSAEKEIFSGRVSLVVASGLLGEIGVTPGHSPLLTQLKPGEVRVTDEYGKESIYYVSGGMLEVQPYCVTVLADEAERADCLDQAEAEKARARAEEALVNKGTEFDHSMAAAELARAAAQIRAIRKVKSSLK